MHLAAEHEWVAINQTSPDLHSAIDHRRVLLIGNRHALLQDRRCAHRVAERAVPFVRRCFPSDDHALAAILVIRLEHQALAFSPRERQQIDGSALVRRPPRAHQARPGHMRRNRSALFGREEVVERLVGQQRKDRFLVQQFGAKGIDHADGAIQIGAHERMGERCIAVARQQLAGEHPLVHQIDGKLGRCRRFRRLEAGGDQAPLAVRQIVGRADHRLDAMVVKVALEQHKLRMRRQPAPVENGDSRRS
ncbi:MAG: hypothetical protein RMJ55_18865 [Roseiflexaceae bacterium]|nr:hypothetical protein [Roseiflexaceae bacterium]